MSLLQSFLWALFSVVGLAVAVCILLRSPLGPLLTELCGGEVRGRFWVAFAWVAMVLSTIFTALFAVPDADAVETELALLRTFTSTVRAGLFGLLASMTALGFVLLLTIARFESRQRPERPKPNFLGPT